MRGARRSTDFADCADGWGWSGGVREPQISPIPQMIVGRCAVRWMLEGSSLNLLNHEIHEPHEKGTAMRLEPFPHCRCPDPSVFIREIRGSQEAV